MRLAMLALTLLPTAGLAQDPLNQIRAQTFTLDPAHSSVVFSITHLGLAEYTASFDEIAATLELDPSDPASARLEASITAASLDLPAPPAGFLAKMLSAEWFDAEAHPQIIFSSTLVTLTGATSARIDGTLSLRGQTAPVSLTASYNTAFPAGVIEPHPRIGFTAIGDLNRSDFGMSIGLPPEGTTFGVGDIVRFEIQAEFVGTPPPD